MMNAIEKGFFCIVLIGVASGAFAQDEGIVFPESVFKTITIDGDFSDWDGVPAACQDTVGDGGAFFDFAAAYLANDNEYLYIRITFAEPSPYPDAFWYTNVAFNTDLESNTGFDWGVKAGSEFDVQGASIFDQRSGNFNDTPEQNEENNWGTFANVEVAPFETTTDIEIAIRRDLVYQNDENGLPGLLNPDGSLLLEYEDFIVVFETEDLDYNGVEWMPNPDANGEAGILYMFAESPTSITHWPLY